MQVLKATTAATVLVAMALAGCSGGASAGGGFSIKESGGAYTFTASGSADNYTWDLGDHLTRAYTKSVTHTYDFESGVVPVTLVVTKAGKQTEYRKEITLGDGTNENAGFVLEGSTNWTVIGESVSFSAHRSSDPDGDPLRYTWSCQRTGDAVRQSVHTHPGFGGVPFATPPAGSVFSVNAQGPLPAADRTVSGDLCDGLGQGGRPSLDTTISGSFSRTGIYDIYLLASDPVHPTTSGKYRIVVTSAAEKPPQVLVQPFVASFVAGSGGAVYSVVCETAQQCDGAQQRYDRASWQLQVPLPVNAGWLALDYTDPSTAMEIECELSRGTTVIGTATGPGQNVTLEPAQVTAGTYTLTCTPQAVVPTDADGVEFTATVGADLKLDPFLIY